MRTRPLLAVAALLALALLALPSPAAASFHVTRIVQIYGGDVTHPDAQYVVLQMCIDNQNLMDGRSWAFYNAAGAQIGGLSTFDHDMTNSASQAKMLVATSSAQTLFGLTADLRMPASLLTGGGKVCFFPSSPIDCVGWGAYTALPDPSIGTPYASGVGLPPGQAIQRDLTIDGLPTVLDCLVDFDDTDDSAADFDPVPATPVNNGNIAGVINTDHVFLHGFEAGTTGGWSIVLP